MPDSIDKSMLLVYNSVVIKGSDLTAEREVYIMEKNYLDLLFYDDASGEEFLVEMEIPKDADMRFVINDAYEIAKENFENPELIDILDVAVAERLGLDTY